MERFRRFTKWEHKFDITPLLKKEDITDTNWTTKEAAVQEDFIWGVGPEALYQITRAEYRTDPDSIKTKDLIRLYTEHYLPKRNTYRNRGDFFWAKQSENETPENIWRRQIEIEKECNSNTTSAEKLLISKYVTAITDKKLRDKMMKEINPRNEKSDRTDKTKHIREEKQKEYNTRSPHHYKRKTTNQRRTNTKNGEIRYQTKNENYLNTTMQIL